MWSWFAVIVASLLIVLPASADDAMSTTCRGTRARCEAEMRDACPHGAEVVEEGLAPSAGPSRKVTKEYTLVYRCNQVSTPARAPAIKPRSSARLAPGAREMTAEEHKHLRESQIEILRMERARVRVGAPIGVLVTGGAFIGIQTYLSIYTGDPHVALMWPLLVPSLVANVTGVIWLTKSVRKRRALSREIDRLSNDGSVAWSLGPLPSGAAGSLSLRF